MEGPDSIGIGGRLPSERVAGLLAASPNFYRYLNGPRARTLQPTLPAGTPIAALVDNRQAPTNSTRGSVKYNKQRPHQGRRCYGKTPNETFIDGTLASVDPRGSRA